MKGITVVLFLLVVPFAAAETYFGFGGGSNFISVEDASATYWITANLRMQPREHFAIEPEIGIWSKTVTSTSCFLGCSTQTVDLRDTNVGLNFYYTFGSGSVRWAVGAGPSIHFQNGTIRLFGVSSDNETSFGGQVLGGADFPLSERTRLFLMIRADYVDTFDLQAKVYGGLRLRL